MQLWIVSDAARVDYPEFPCGGVWVLDQTGKDSVGIERLTYGTEFCWDELLLKLAVLPDGRLQVSWHDGDEQIVAKATLDRVVKTESSKAKSAGRK